MSREDVFKATGPTSGSSMTVKIGVKRDGTITAAEGAVQVAGRRLPGLAVHEHLHVRLRALRHRERARGRLRRGVQPAEGRGLSGARARRSRAFAVESVLDVLAQKIGMDPLQLRLKNAAQGRHTDALRHKARP